jgi:hypothetical protein
VVRVHMSVTQLHLQRIFFPHSLTLVVLVGTHHSKSTIGFGRCIMSGAEVSWDRGSNKKKWGDNKKKNEGRSNVTKEVNGDNKNGSVSCVHRFLVHIRCT